MRRAHDALLAVLLCATATPTIAAQTIPLRIAHRGGTGDAPENTLVAVRTALDNGADAAMINSPARFRDIAR